jgi:translation initiation factor IF-1
LPHKSQERAQRQPHYKQATLILEGGQKVTVAIKNLSPTGARIETRERMLLPDEVVLTEATLNLRRRARVVWQHDGIAGLQFIEQ